MTAKLIARCAMGAALAVALLYTASAVPSGRLGLTAAAGLAFTPALLLGGWKAGLLAYAAALIPAFFWVPNKGIWLLFALFFGFYPAVKLLWEQKCPRWFCLTLKCLLANGVLAAFFGLGRTVFGMPEWIASRFFLFILVGNAAFFAYDWGYSQLIVYLRRFDKFL